MTSIPLPLLVDHSTWQQADRLEHIDYRHEHVLVDFLGEYDQDSSEDLTKLLNYADVYNQISKMAGSRVIGPMESVAEELLSVFEQSAQRQAVPLLSAQCRITRLAYLHAKTHVSLVHDYTK